jgi:uncharacterized protein DUF6174
VKRTVPLAGVLLFAAAACSRLPLMTADSLRQAEDKWRSHKPDAYRLVIEMSGDRVDPGRFEIEVRSGEVVSMRRNGLVIRAGAAQDYSIEGLFHMLEQELGVAEKPATVGAPPGYMVYTNAKFDDVTGRLIRYRRIVGGTSNSIEVSVVQFEDKLR